MRTSTLLLSLVLLVVCAMASAQFQPIPPYGPIDPSYCSEIVGRPSVGDWTCVRLERKTVTVRDYVWYHSGDLIVDGDFPMPSTNPKDYVVYASGFALLVEGNFSVTGDIIYTNDVVAFISIEGGCLGSLGGVRVDWSNLDYPNTYDNDRSQREQTVVLVNKTTDDACPNPVQSRKVPFSYSPPKSYCKTFKTSLIHSNFYIGLPSIEIDIDYLSRCQTLPALFSFLAIMLITLIASLLCYFIWIRPRNTKDHSYTVMM